MPLETVGARQAPTGGSIIGSGSVVAVSGELLQAAVALLAAGGRRVASADQRSVTTHRC